MAERYPDDGTLLSLAADEATGVEYIPTGLSPYYLAFRRMLWRLLRASERANDLRVYESGDLTVGVRAGRCFVDDAAVNFEGAEEVAVPTGEQTRVWLDGQGEVQTGADWPGDWGTYVPLAEVQAGPERITSIADRRGAAFLNVLSLKGLGVSASGPEIGQALEGIDPEVTAGALSTLCAGGHSNADGLHHHRQLVRAVDELAVFELINVSAGMDAGVGLSFHLGAWVPEPVHLELDRESGWLRQRQGEAEAGYVLMGSTAVHAGHAGVLSATQMGLLCGLMPVDGVVEAVVLSVGENIVSSEGDDGVSARVYVNGTAVCDTDPALTSSDGGGFRSTQRGDGTQAAVKDDGTEQVQKGDVVTVDLEYDEQGSVSQAMEDVAVLVSVRAGQPI